MKQRLALAVVLTLLLGTETAQGHTSYVTVDGVRSWSAMQRFVPPDRLRLRLFVGQHELRPRQVRQGSRRYYGHGVVARATLSEEGVFRIRFTSAERRVVRIEYDCVRIREGKLHPCPQ